MEAQNHVNQSLAESVGLVDKIHQVRIEKVRDARMALKIALKEQAAMQTKYPTIFGPNLTINASNLTVDNVITLLEIRLNLQKNLVHKFDERDRAIDEQREQKQAQKKQAAEKKKAIVILSPNKLNEEMLETYIESFQFGFLTLEAILDQLDTLASALSASAADGGGGNGSNEEQDLSKRSGNGFS